MKVHELITELQKHDPEMEVQIQVNESEYWIAKTVRQKDLFSNEDATFCYDTDLLKPEPYVVIQYE